MALKTEQIKTPEKIQLSDEETANLSDAHFKTLVIGMLTEMVEYGFTIEEKVKAMKSEIKGNVQGTNSEGKETGTHVNSLEQKEEINIQPEHNEETRIQKKKKNEETFEDNFKHSNIWIIEMPRGEEEEQEIENLFEQIMKDNYRNMVKEIDFQEVQEALRVTKKLDWRRNTPRHIIITLAKINQKEKILEAAREKDTVSYKGVPIRLYADFSKQTLQVRRGWKEVFEVMKGKDLHPRLLYPAKLSFGSR